MSELFISILNMSISAGWIVIALLILRVLLKKAPKRLMVLPWAIVGIRLVCPFSFESVLSLIPSKQTVPPDIALMHDPSINSGIPIVNEIVNPIITESFTLSPATSANPLQILIPVWSIIWLAGVSAMLIYTAVSYLRVRSRVRRAVLLRDNIYQCETVGSPFVLGIIKPKIYLPFNISERAEEYVIAHEQAHLSRKDHVWKPLGFLILSVYWFNPLLWLGYILLCRDIELACDEKVIDKLDTEHRADYSEALLSCSVNRRMIAACPLAFGEMGVKKRIKNVLGYKKPAFWIAALAITVIIATAVCLLTDPKTDKPQGEDGKGSDTVTVIIKDRVTSDINGQTVVYLSDSTSCPLALCPTYDGQVYTKQNRIAYIDFDGDGIEEALIDCADGGYYILSYDASEGRLYAIFFSPRGGCVFFANGEYWHSDQGMSRYRIKRFNKGNIETVTVEYTGNAPTTEEPDWSSIDLAMNESPRLWQNDILPEKTQILYIGDDIDGEEMLVKALDDIYGTAPQISFIDVSEGKQAFLIIPAADCTRVCVSLLDQSDAPAVLEELYVSENPEPIAVKGNRSDVMSDILITLTVGGREYRFAPILSLVGEGGQVSVEYPFGAYSDFVIQEIGQ